MINQSAIIDDIQSLVIYEDESLIAVNKPNNLLVHHSHYSRNVREISLIQHLRSHFEQQLFPIHRLDRKTSGVILFGKSQEAAKHYQSLFDKKEVQKTYYALVRGFTAESGEIDSPIRSVDSSEYKEALTQFRTIQQIETNFPVGKYENARYSLIELTPITGRTHQLRKHMNKVSHPIIGDPKYGDRHHNHAFQKLFGHEFLFLHAKKIAFSTNELVIANTSFPEFWNESCKKIGISLQDL